MIRILVVDDHDIVRLGLVRMLSDVEGFEIIGEAKSGEEALIEVRKLHPDVVLMDVRMPGMGGIEATRKMCLVNETVKVIAVTSCEDELFPIKLMDAGAAGYVTKGSDISEVIAAIKAVSRGERYLSEDIAKHLALRNVSRHHATTSPFELLSERELQTAILIANGKKAQEIADTFCVSPKTVNTYRYRIFEKLNLNSDVELALLAVKHNILDLERVG